MKKTSRIISFFLMIAMIFALISTINVTVNAQGERYTVLVLDASATVNWQQSGTTIYTAGAPIDNTKAGAKNFCRQAITHSKIAIVAYAGESYIVSNFTDNLNELYAKVDTITVPTLPDNSVWDDCAGNIAPALQNADHLLSQISNNSIKNIVIFSSGITNPKHTLKNGYYSGRASDWWFIGHVWRINLYEGANAVYEQAKILKNKYNVYSIGIFQNYKNVPSIMNNAVGLLRDTVKDMASNGNQFYDVDDPNDLEFVFGDVADDIIKELSNDRLTARSAFFANETYKDHGRGTPVIWNNETWQVDSTITVSVGTADHFRYMIFTKGNDVIISFRGMVPNKNGLNVIDYFLRNVGTKESDNVQAVPVYQLVHGAFEPYLMNPSNNIYITGHSMGGYLSIMAYKYIRDRKLDATIKRVDTFNAVGLPKNYVSELNNTGKILNHQTCCDIARQWSNAQGLDWPGSTSVHSTTARNTHIAHIGNIINFPAPLALAAAIDAHNMKWFLTPTLVAQPAPNRQIVRIACPVDVEISFNNETLSNANDTYNDETSWGALYLLGEKRDIKVAVIDADKPVEIKIVGTDTGTMDYSIEFFDEDFTSQGIYAVEKVPITKTTNITTTTDQKDNLTLKIDSNGDGKIDTTLALTKLGASVELFPVTSGGVYTIQHKGSDKFISSGLTTDVRQSYIWQYNNHDDQRYRITHIIDDWYTIVSTHSGMALDLRLDSDGMADGVAIDQYPLHGRDNQLWKFVDCGDGYFKIINKHSQKCLDVAGNRSDNGNVIHSWEDNGTDAQRFKLIKIQDAALGDIGFNGEVVIENNNLQTSPKSIIIKGREYNTDLEELDLWARNLSNADIEPLKYMTNLKKLNLAGNNITNIKPLEGLVKLTELGLSVNKISNLIPLKNLVNLRILDLGDNQIEDVSSLNELKKLQRLYLWGNPIKEAKVIALRNLLQNCDIFY